MEFQAVIMAAGSGSRMSEITSGIPKCLLPVGNVPLVMGALQILKDAGFTDAIVVVKETEKARIQSAIENKLNMKMDIVAIPKNEDWGTADSLRFIKDKIKSNVIVFSCDIVSDFSLQNMLNEHRTQNSSLTVLLVPIPKSLRESDTPGSKKKCKFERDVIGLDSHDRLVFVNSEADFEEDVPLKLNVLGQNSGVKVHSNLMDAHVYVIRRDLVDFIINTERISTLKGEFLPAAVRKQFFCKKPINGTTSPSAFDPDSLDLKKLSLELTRNSSVGNHSDGVVCMSYIDRKCFCSRVNTMTAYADINRKISKNLNLITSDSLKPHAFQKSQVDADSIIGETCELLLKSSLKQSVVGQNCKLNERTKIINSVVLDNVVFGKECSVQGSIICSNVVIEDRVSLKNCVIGPDQTIQSSSKHNSEILQGSDQLMQI